MIENILVLSRFDNDTYKGNKEKLSLIDLISEQVETVRVIDDNIEVEFENHLDDGGMIISDRKLLIRIIQNLLSNAIKYASSKVKIVARTAHDNTVGASLRARDDARDNVVGASLRAHDNARDNVVGASLRAHDDASMGELREPYYTISVADDGDGIDSSNLENIFTRYYKGEDGHFGIGLAVVKSSVDYLGGKIMVDSEKGKGTTFTCFLMNMFLKQSIIKHRIPFDVEIMDAESNIKETYPEGYFNLFGAGKDLDLTEIEDINVDLDGEIAL